MFDVHKSIQVIKHMNSNLYIWWVWWLCLDALKTLKSSTGGRLASEQYHTLGYTWYSNHLKRDALVDSSCINGEHENCWEQVARLLVPYSNKFKQHVQEELSCRIYQWSHLQHKGGFLNPSKLRLPGSFFFPTCRSTLSMRRHNYDHRLWWLWQCHIDGHRLAPQPLQGPVGKCHKIIGFEPLRVWYPFCWESVADLQV